MSPFSVHGTIIGIGHRDVNGEIHEKIKNCDIWLKIGHNFIDLKIESLNLD